jgi:Flp pilus assembly protein TadG
MNYSRSNHKHKTRAQAMVEFALALPLLLLLVFGLMETGRLLFIYASTVSAAREAVRYGSAMGKNASNVSYYQDCAGIRKAAQNVGFINRFNDADILITYDGGLEDDTGIVIPLSPANPSCGSFSGIKNGDRIKVSVSTQWVPIVSIVPFSGFTITSSSERTVIKSISISQAIPGATALAAPQLISPTEGAFFNTGSSVTFTWNASTGATQYWFEYIGTTSGNSGWISGTSTTPATLADGTYTWHVKARNTSAESSWSASRTFIIGSVPLAPNLSSPAESAHVASGTTPKFTWDVSTGATQYYFEYSDTNSFSTSLGNSTWINDTNFSTASLTSGTYYWRVRAKNTVAPSPWSTVRTLIVDPFVANRSISLSVSPTNTQTDSASLILGEKINYQYTITYTSNINTQASGVTLNSASGRDLSGIDYKPVDNFDRPCSTTIDPGGSLTCYLTRTITQNDVNAGVLSNIFIASATSLADSNSVPTTIKLNRSISITSLSGVLNRNGKDIEFIYILKNNGFATLYDLKVSDTRSTPTTITCPAGALVPPDNSIQCTGVANLTDTEKSDGTVQVIGTATDGGKTVSAGITKTFSTLRVCTTNNNVTLSGPNRTDNNKTHTYTINNGTSVTLHITSISFNWTTTVGGEANEISSIKLGDTKLTEKITTSPFSISGNWNVNKGNTTLVVIFKEKDTPKATNFKITFNEPGCYIP